MNAGTTIISLVIALSGCSSITAARVMTHVNNGLILCDVGQTLYASDGGRWDRPGDGPGTVQRELNPVLGPTPSLGFIGAVGGVDVAVNTAVGYSNLPSWLRWSWIAVVGVVETTLVIEHEKLSGVCGITRT